MSGGKNKLILSSPQFRKAWNWGEEKYYNELNAALLSMMGRFLESHRIKTPRLPPYFESSIQNKKENIMFKKLLKNPYIIGGIVAFVILFVVGVFALEASVSESLLGSAVISVIGVGGLWWKQEVWP